MIINTVKLLYTGPSENLPSLNMMNISQFLKVPAKHFFAREHLTKPATRLNRPFLFAPVLAGLEKFHCTFKIHQIF
jgi:hypothetical protein